MMTFWNLPYDCSEWALLYVPIFDGDRNDVFSLHAGFPNDSKRAIHSIGHVKKNLTTIWTDNVHFYKVTTAS